MEYNTLIINNIEDVMVVTMSRPAALNALNRQTMRELHHFFVESPLPTSMKGVVLTGAGDKAFVAGADIKEFLGLGAQASSDLSAYGHGIFNAIENFPVPVVAAMNGFALGGGLELAMACHIRLASEKAKFGQPEVNLGTIPGYGGTQRLVRLVGLGRAMHWLMTGEMIDAPTALQAGLITGIYPGERLQDEAIKLVRTIAAKAPLAIREIVRTTLANFDPDTDGFQLEIERFGYLFETADFQEGVQAFLEKRKADFQGR